MEPSARQLQASEAAEKTKELSIELHLATFAVAITIVLGSQVEKLVSEDIGKKESNFIPDEVWKMIQYSMKMIHFAIGRWDDSWYCFSNEFLPLSVDFMAFVVRIH